MTISIEDTKVAVVKAMTYRFPRYPVRFESVEDDPRILGLGVFAVAPEDFVAVQDYVFDLEASGLLPNGWELLPLVRDPAATRKYYPEIATNWSLPLFCEFSSIITPPTGRTVLMNYSPSVLEEILESDRVHKQAWTYEPAASTATPQSHTSNKNFALAA